MQAAATSKGPIAALARRWLALYAHFHAFHSYGPPRLVYVGWLLAFTYLSFYFLRFTRPNPDPLYDVPLRAAVFLMMVVLGLRRLWPARLGRYYIPYAYVALLLALPFFTVYQGLERGGGVPAISNCFIALAVVTLLVDWRNQIAMLLIGVSAAVIVFKLEHPGRPIPPEMVRQLPAYLIILVASYVFKYTTEQVDQERKLAAQQEDNERRLAALNETMAFMAHELNTPLATIRGSMSILNQRYAAQPQENAAVAQLTQRYAGEVPQVLERTERAALYCQNLVSTFVSSARQALPGAVVQAVNASDLIRALVNEYPLDEREKSFIAVRIEQDFALTGRRDLLYLVFCTITKNALQAMRSVAQPRLEISVGVAPPREGEASGRGWVRFADNGCGIAPELLPRLTQEPVSTRVHEGGSGMGLVFCRRVMESLGGSMRVESRQGEGATVTLEFDPSRAPA